MQTDPHWQEQTLARFILASRQHLGLIQVPASIKPPRRIAGSSRKLLRSLVIASSLGALFSAPAIASEGSRQSEPVKRSPNAHGPRGNADNQTGHSHRLSGHGRYR